MNIEFHDKNTSPEYVSTEYFMITANALITEDGAWNAHDRNLRRATMRVWPMVGIKNFTVGMNSEAEVEKWPPPIYGTCDEHVFDGLHAVGDECRGFKGWMESQ